MNNKTVFRRVEKSLKLIGKDKKVVPGGPLAFGQWSIGSNSKLDTLEKKFINLLLTNFSSSDAKEINILDAGCGNGLDFMPIINKFRLNKIPIIAHFRDIQSEAVTATINNYRSVPTEVVVDVKQGDVSTLDFPKASLDGIYIKSVLGWLPSLEVINQTVLGFNKIIKPGGLVYVSTMSPYNQVGINCDISKRDNMWQKVNTTGQEINEPIIVYNGYYQRPVSLFTRNALNRLFQENGFKIVSSEYFRNELFSNGFSDEYPENVNLIARKA